MNPLDLEKQRIADRMASLEKAFSSWVATEEYRMKQHDMIIEKLTTLVLGNGHVGMAEDVRNLKKIQDKKEAHVKILYGGMIAGFCDWLYRAGSHWIK